MSPEQFSFLLSPHSYGGFGGLVADGLTPARAFDVIAERARAPEFQAMIRTFEESAAGRELLADISGWWDAEGLPCPWDTVLELPKHVNDDHAE
ncbi:MAG: hypothetical protein NVSMB42_21890 [Herpetosiphon sp.]